MKLSELKPCDHCGGPLPPSWWIVRVSQAMLDREATQETLGLMQMLGGSLAIAEAMGARSEEAVLVMGDKVTGLWTEIFLCQDCALGMNDDHGDYNLGELLVKVEERKKREAKHDDGA